MHKKYEILFCIYFQSFDFVVLLLWLSKKKQLHRQTTPQPLHAFVRKPAALSGRQGVDFNWATTVKTRYGNTVCSMNLGHTPVLYRLTYLLFPTPSLCICLFSRILLTYPTYWSFPRIFFFLEWVEWRPSQRWCFSASPWLDCQDLFSTWALRGHYQPKQGTIIGEISRIYIPYLCIKFWFPPN